MYTMQISYLSHIHATFPFIFFKGMKRDQLLSITNLKLTNLHPDTRTSNGKL